MFGLYEVCKVQSSIYSVLSWRVDVVSDKKADREGKEKHAGLGQQQQQIGNQLHRSFWLLSQG